MLEFVVEEGSSRMVKYMLDGSAIMNCEGVLMNEIQKTSWKEANSIVQVFDKRCQACLRKNRE